MAQRVMTTNPRTVATPNQIGRVEMHIAPIVTPMATPETMSVEARSME
jgi:hypothetical protein